MVGPGVPCKIKLSDELWSASQKRSTSAKWRFFRRRRRSVATKLLTAHHVVRDGMTGLGIYGVKKLCSLAVGNCLWRLLAIPAKVEIAEERQDSSDQSQPDQDQHCRFVAPREGCFDRVG